MLFFTIINLYKMIRKLILKFFGYYVILSFMTYFTNAIIIHSGPIGLSITAILSSLCLTMAYPLMDFLTIKKRYYFELIFLFFIFYIFLYLFYMYFPNILVLSNFSIYIQFIRIDIYFTKLYSSLIVSLFLAIWGIIEKRVI